MEVNGFLNLNKPAGPTSFSLVGLVRRLTGIRRVGHGGTLDPAAGGVLPICIGQGARMAEYLLEGSKEYVARVRLGVSTNTYDAEGEVTAERDPGGIQASQVEALLPVFTGSILQVPPMFSALKKEGKRLYTLARAGVEVEREARPVHVYRMALSGWDPPFFTLTVECSRGTYIRSLAADLGEALGCGAHLAALTRTRVGPFRLEDAVTPEGLTRAAEGGWWEAYLHALDHLVLHLPAAILDEPASKAISDGRMCPVDGALRPPAENELCRAYSDDGRLLALMTFDGAAGGWKPDKVFAR